MVTNSQLKTTLQCNINSPQHTQATMNPETLAWPHPLWVGLLCPQPALFVHKRVQVTEQTFQNKAVYTLTPKLGANSRLMLIYLHGGAYVLPCTRPHWKLATDLVTQLDCTLVMPDYPLAPEDSAQNIQQFVNDFVANLSRQNPHKTIVLMGDSAGGGLALACAQGLTTKDLGKPHALAHLMLLSPWINLEITPTNAPLDSLLTLEQARHAAQLYAGSQPKNNPLLSPALGSLTDLPPISLWIGTHDLLWPDAVIFQKRLAATNQPHHFFVYPNMGHTWFLFPHLAEAQQALHDIVTTLKSL